MNKSELITKIHENYPFLTMAQVTDVVNVVFEEMVSSLAKGKRIEIRGFGSFSVRRRKVQSKFPTSPEEKIAFEKKNVVYFREGKEFFNQLNSSDEH